MAGSWGCFGVLVAERVLPWVGTLAAEWSGGERAQLGVYTSSTGDLTTAYDDRLGSSVALGCKGEAGVKRNHGMRFDGEAIRL